MLDNQLSPATPYESKRREEMAGFHVPDISSPRGTVSGENAYGTITPKDVQLILSKLDLINSRLDNINRRLEMLESGKKAGQNLW
jgi:hypothetical protein